ncbi:transmembrane protein 245 [Homalodisca vitripennis]|nr:transmembrane protein 245 [Homalodisca vitripennis]
MDTPKIKSTFFEGSILGSKYEKPIKKALNNVIALILICSCSFFAWLSFLILQPFLKPLFWALLCGSVLHPLKKRLSSHFKTWIIWFEDTDFRLPIVIGIVSCPIKLFFDVSDYVGELLCKHWMKIVCGVLMAFLSGLTYNYTPQILICLSWNVLKFMVKFIELTTSVFENPSLVTTVVLAFLISITLCWDPKYEKHFLSASYAVWFAISAYTASYFYYVKLPAFILFQMLFISGVLLSHKVNLSQSVDNSPDGKNESQETTNVEQTSYLQENVDSSISSPSPTKSLRSSDNVTRLLRKFRSYTSENTSDIYLYWVSVACVVTLFLRSGWLPYCVALLLIVYTVRCLCRSFGITDFVTAQYSVLKNSLNDWYLDRKEVLIPAPISCLNSIFLEMRVRLLCWLRESSDSASSVMVILALVFCVIFGSTFLVIQAYTEGMYMMKVGGNVINQTVVHNPELTQLLPEGWEHTVDSVLNNAYTYGREALSKLVRNMMTGVSQEKTEELEKRALEVWDRVYQAWMMSTIETESVGPKVTSSAVYQTWDHFLDAMHKTPELVSMNALTQLAQNNMAMLTSGLESAWDLIRGNASLVFSAFLTVLTVVFSHSFAVLNFCINMIIFLTALFYLLSSSQQLYKPVEVMTAVSPVFGGRIAFAMENAVNEVLTGSFKLALFYGMWTWLIHTLFQMNIVYIPSVFAAMLAVVPALGTYWACLPAVIDLWLAQGKNIHAITLAVCQFLPTLFVDATIYTEINEGHPYLTGLSVAGGLFWLGMEGAIIGPLILCCLYVVVSLSTAVMQEATTTTPFTLAPPTRR